MLKGARQFLHLFEGSRVVVIKGHTDQPGACHPLTDSLTTLKGWEGMGVQATCQGGDFKHVPSLSDFRKFNLLLKGVVVTR